MKCQIKWVDDKGNDTPDDNEAVGIARIRFYRDGEETSVSEFPICAEHLSQMPDKPYMRWNGEKVSEWEFEEF